MPSGSANQSCQPTSSRTRLSDESSAAAACAMGHEAASATVTGSARGLNVAAVSIARSCKSTRPELNALCDIGLCTHWWRAQENDIPSGQVRCLLPTPISFLRVPAHRLFPVCSLSGNVLADTMSTYIQQIRSCGIFKRRPGSRTTCLGGRTMASAGSGTKLVASSSDGI